MERTDFIERINKRTLLKNDSSADWNNLSKRYPYSALVQLLNFQNKKEITDADKRALRIHFENPIHYNVVTKNQKPELVAEEVLEPKKEINKEVSTQETKTIEESKKEIEHKSETQGNKTKARLPKEKEIKPSTEFSSEGADKSKISSQEVKQDSQAETAKPTDLVTDKKTDEDVLELIKDLPEENPIKKAKTVPDSEDFSADAQNEVYTGEDPQDLMVMMSFTDWLQHFKAKKENEEADKKGRDAIRSAWQKEKLAEAMDDEEDVVPDEIFEKAMKSVSFGDGLVTEPLAELYVQQGKIDQAIELYKKLSLLNPEKRTYFADRIKNLHL